MKTPEISSKCRKWIGIVFTGIVFYLGNQIALASTIWSTGPISGGGFVFNAPSVSVTALPDVDIIVFDVDIFNSANYDGIEIQIAGGGPGNLQPILGAFAISDGDLLPSAIQIKERVAGVNQAVEFVFDSLINPSSNPSHLAVAVNQGVVATGSTLAQIRMFPEGTSFAGFFSLGVGEIGRYTLSAGLAAELTSGSKAALLQNIIVPSSAFTVEFDYAFETTTGTVEVTINGVVIGSLDASAASGTGFQRASFDVDGALLAGLQSADGSMGRIEFSIDGVSGSQVILDNVQFPGALNGGFDVDSFFGWDLFTEGAASGLLVDEALAPPAVVPLPAAVWLFGTALVGFVGYGRRRKIT